MNPEDLKKKILKFELLGGFVIFILIIITVFSIPSSKLVFPQYFDVPKGSTLSSVADSLQSKGFIRGELSFKICVYLFGGSKHLMAGVYQFERPIGPCVIAERIVRGVYSITPEKITIPEGFLKKEIAIKFSNFPRFDTARFMDEAKEGYLFPDTYFFNHSMTDTEIAQIMTNNFDKQIKSLESDIAKSKRSLDDIIKVASIVERETIFPEDRPKVAQVLWRRLDLKIPLQADVTFAYINGKGTFQLTDEDLKTDSPYNTYNRVGLPPTPIGNPGLDSIKAALYPSDTKYLYFLSDKKGRMYFAKTFEEHQVNREKYLGK